MYSEKCSFQYGALMYARIIVIAWHFVIPLVLKPWLCSPYLISYLMSVKIGSACIVLVNILSVMWRIVESCRYYICNLTLDGKIYRCPQVTFIKSLKKNKQRCIKSIKESIFCLCSISVLHNYWFCSSGNFC